MSSIALIMQKGGSGKTTAGVNIATAALAAGHNVVLVDLDPQGSATTWHAVRMGQEGRAVAGADISLETATVSTLAGVLAKHKDSLVIIDTPPHNSTMTATVLGLVDMAIVPVRPAAFDLAAVSDTAAVIARSKCGMVGSVLNGGVPQSLVGAEIGEALANAGLPVVGQLHQRVAFQHAAAAGLGVIEYSPRSKAAEEVAALWQVIAGQLLKEAV